MARKTTTPWPPSSVLDNASMQVGQPAAAEAIGAWAGDVLTMHAWTMGNVSLPGSTPHPCPVAPGGTGRGHDHSGGLAGRPLFRPVWSDHSSPFDLLDSGVDDVSARMLKISGITQDNIDYNDAGRPMLADIPGCEPGEYGAYNALDVQVMAWVDSNTSPYTSWHAGDVVRLIIDNLTTGGQVYWDLDLTSSGNHGAELFLTSDGADGPTTLLAMAPGRPNVLRVRLKVNLHSSSTATAAVLWVPDIELGVSSDDQDP